MEDTYVYVSVKLYLNGEQTEDSIQEIIQDMDYSFTHDDIAEHEIVDIIDMQIDNYTEENTNSMSHVDLFDISDASEYKIDE